MEILEKEYAISFSGLFSKDANSPSIFDRLGKFISGSFSGKFTGFVNLLKNAGSVIKSFFDGLFGKKSALEGVAKGASSTLAPGLKKLSDEADSYVQGIGRLQNAINTVYGGLNKTFNSENMGKHVGEFAESLQKADADIPKTLPEKLKAIFDSFKTDFVGPAIEKASEAFGKLKAFVANVDYKKLLLAAKALRTVQQTLSGIKLANSFSGMAKNIGGFFKSLSEDGLKINAIPEESKFSKMVKVAIAIALVAKAMSMIAAIPEDRLASSVGVVAGITAVMTGIIIAFEKIKSAEGSDLSGAAKTMIAMSAAIYILAKAMEMLGDQDPASLIAGGAAISALVFVLTKAAKSLKDAKLNPGDAMAPVGFAIALKILTGVVLSFAKTPPADLLQGIIITTLMLQLLKGAVKQLKGLKLMPSSGRSSVGICGCAWLAFGRDSCLFACTNLDAYERSGRYIYNPQHSKRSGAITQWVTIVSGNSFGSDSICCCIGFTCWNYSYSWNVSNRKDEYGF